MNTKNPENSIRPAAVAGYFYPADSSELQKMINKLMDKATAAGPAPKALIAPHAGYIYSGLTAAMAYANLQSIKDKIKRVVLAGPAHRVYLRGIALSRATHFATPLGNIEIDQDAVKFLKKLPQVIVSDAAHQQEHSLEVHLPFLQTLLKNFTLVPLVVGEASPQEVAEVLELFWGEPDTIIIISSDLSHYHDYETAKRIDAGTTYAIEHLELEKIGPEEACGCRPLCGMLQLARTRNLSVNTLDVRNSGDTAGTKDRVVGYGAWSFV
jgi:AmmeMemoRadiSam system protein B